MRIIHTADLHLGQVIYQNYDRSDEHRHFFSQLKSWCQEYKPDALVVSGDLFDIQQPSAVCKKAFNDYFVDVRKSCPDMTIVLTAGNHDSASRIQADSAVWGLADTIMVGTPPATNPADGWESKYIVALPSGYIIAMPYMPNERKELLQHLLDVVADRNSDGKPVVMMGHTAVTGLDLLGHNIEIGTLRTQDTDSFGSGFDYLALGHIHKPQTIGHLDDAHKLEVTYPAPVVRYSGSALHVSCDEAYPHSVSLVDIDRRGGEVTIRQLRIDELRHFYVLPQDGAAYTSSDDAIRAVQDFCDEFKQGYIRLQVEHDTELPPNFNQMVYDILAKTQDEVRYNPKVIWHGIPEPAKGKADRHTFEVETFQQMSDPFEFVRTTIEQYPGLDLKEVEEAFREVRVEVDRIRDEETQKAKAKAGKKSDKITETDEEENEN